MVILRLSPPSENPFIVFAPKRNLASFLLIINKSCMQKIIKTVQVVFQIFRKCGDGEYNRAFRLVVRFSFDIQPLLDIINPMIYFSQSQLLPAKINENRTTSRKALLQYTLRLRLVHKKSK